MRHKTIFSSSKSHKEYYSSKNNKPYQDLQTIIIEKGTKRIRVRVRPITKNTQTDLVQKIMCNTCEQEIKSEICKVLVMRNKDDNPQIFHYHFFFPCWNFEMLCRKYSNLTLERVGISIPENIIMTENATLDLKNNFEFWK